MVASCGLEDMTSHFSKEEFHRVWPLDMVDEKGETVSDGAGGLHTLHKQTQLFQRGDQGGTDEHRSSNGPGGALRGTGW